MRPLKEKIALIIATGCFSGYGRPFSGTWGTIPAWLISFYLIEGDQPLLMAAIAVTFLLSVWSAGEAEKIFGHDNGKIVIDEWAGMFVSLLFVPYSLLNYINAFFAFRFFDVVKIPPARQFERLPSGWGVTMDDIVAGIHANLATQLAIYILNNYYYS